MGNSVVDSNCIAIPVADPASKASGLLSDGLKKDEK
jgi:hypothetical protein